MSGDLDVAQVANYFIEKSWEQYKPLTPIKLTGLLWQANGFWLAITSRPLFSEKFRHSQEGVLLLSIFDKFTNCNNEPILSKFDEDNHNNSVISSKKIYSEKYQLLLNKIWQMYAHYPQDFLCYLSRNINKYENNANNFSEVCDDNIILCFREELKKLNISNQNSNVVVKKSDYQKNEKNIVVPELEDCW